MKVRERMKLSQRRAQYRAFNVYQPNKGYWQYSPGHKANYRALRKYHALKVKP